MWKASWGETPDLCSRQPRESPDFGLILLALGTWVRSASSHWWQLLLFTGPGLGTSLASSHRTPVARGPCGLVSTVLTLAWGLKQDHKFFLSCPSQLLS